jgi:hypothetical protein
MKRLILACTASIAMLAPLIAANAPPASAAGNSGAAHACQQGGYLSLVGADGTTFRNVGACVSFAAHGGQFATGLIIPAGETATLYNVFHCVGDSGSYGYQLNLGANVLVYADGNCGGSLPGTTVGPFPTATLLRIWLTDTACGPGDWTYYSDGNHALVTGSNPWQVGIADSFFCTYTAADPRPPASSTDADLTLDVSIS